MEPHGDRRKIHTYIVQQHITPFRACLVLVVPYSHELNQLYLFIMNLQSTRYAVKKVVKLSLLGFISIVYISYENEIDGK